jgi:hypothetical protein
MQDATRIRHPADSVWEVIAIQPDGRDGPRLALCPTVTAAQICSHNAEANLDQLLAPPDTRAAESMLLRCLRGFVELYYADAGYADCPFSVAEVGDDVEPGTMAKALVWRGAKRIAPFLFEEKTPDCIDPDM